MIKIEIPVKPLSNNRMWQGKRFKTKDYKQYEYDCMWFMGAKKITGEVEIHYKFFIKNYALSDVDNFLKPIQDIMVKSGIIEDDRKIKRIVAEKFKSDDDRIEIDIFKYS